MSTEPNQSNPQAVAEAAIRLEAWLVGRQANVHPEISTTLVRAEPYDRSSSSYTLAESDLRAVLAEQDMCTCNEPREVCELRTELDQVRAQLNAALAGRDVLAARVAELEGKAAAKTETA